MSIRPYFMSEDKVCTRPARFEPAFDALTPSTNVVLQAFLLKLCSFPSNLSIQFLFWSVWLDLNQRPSASKADTLRRLSYTLFILAGATRFERVTFGIKVRYSTN